MRPFPEPPPRPMFAPVAPLAPSIARLVELGVLERALDDGTRGAFLAQTIAATRRGELTAAQASALAALVGLEGPPAARAA
jgi:hypothetical protein